MSTWFRNRWLKEVANVITRIGYGSDSGFSSSSVEGTSPEGQNTGPSKAAVVVPPKIVSTGWPLSRKSTGHFDPSRDPRLLYL